MFLKSSARFAVFALIPVAAWSWGMLDGATAAQYPHDFRRWVHIGTGVIMPGGPIPESEQGMHHIFANGKAVAGYPSANFADGSIIVYELRQTEEKNGVIFEGARRRVDVMIKDSRLAKSTGGWRFERFFGDDQLKDVVSDSGKSCFECHEKVSTHGLVFSHLSP